MDHVLRIQRPRGSTFEYNLIIGAVENVAIFKQSSASFSAEKLTTVDPFASIDDIEETLGSAIDSQTLCAFLQGWSYDNAHNKTFNSSQGFALMGLEFASSLYGSLEQSTISIELLNLSIFEAGWLSSLKRRRDTNIQQPTSEHAPNSDTQLLDEAKEEEPELKDEQDLQSQTAVAGSGSLLKWSTSQEKKNDVVFSGCDEEIPTKKESGIVEEALPSDDGDFFLPKKKKKRKENTVFSGWDEEIPMKKASEIVEEALPVDDWGSFLLKKKKEKKKNTSSIWLDEDSTDTELEARTIPEPILDVVEKLDSNGAWARDSRSRESSKLSLKKPVEASTDRELQPRDTTPTSILKNQLLPQTFAEPIATPDIIVVESATSSYPQTSDTIVASPVL